MSHFKVFRFPRARFSRLDFCAKLILKAVFDIYFEIQNCIILIGKYGVTMIPGDGVGPEIMDAVQTVVKSVGAPIDFEVMHLSEVICFHF